MSHVYRASYHEPLKDTPEEELKEILGQPKWQTVDIKITHVEFILNFTTQYAQNCLVHRFD